MLSFTRNLKLKNQVLFLIGIVIFAMIFFQFFFYLNSYHITQKGTSKHAENLIKQVEEKLESIFINIQGIAKKISYNGSVQELLITDEPNRRMELLRVVSSILDLMKDSDINIEEIRLVDQKEREISSTSVTSYLVLKEIASISELFKKKQNEPIFSPVVYDEEFRKDHFSYIAPIFLAYQSDKPFNCIGYIIIICKTEQIKSIVKDVSLTGHSVFLVQDMKGNLAAINDDTLIDGKIDNDEKGMLINFNELTEQFDKNSYMKQEQVVDKTGWKVTTIIPRNELTEDFKAVIRYGFAINGIIIIILFIIGAAIISGITVPVSKIVKFIGTVEKSESKKRLNVPGNNEIGRIAVNINKMLDDIDIANRQVLQSQTILYEAKLAKKQAELLALQSQINPHYLYNTLNCIRSMALRGGVPAIASMSNAMSMIFRYSIKEKDFVAVKEEVECIKNYIYIMQVRFLDRFNYTIDIDNDIMQMKIPKMILQPIIENAIYHGLEPKRGNGELWVRGKLIGDSIVSFEVSDNGIGMEEEEVNKLRDELTEAANTRNFSTYSDQKRSIGLFNIYKRLKLTFGDECVLKLYSNKTEGTRVIIVIPAES